MRAITFTAFGGPDVLAVDNRPIPEATAGHVRVRVHAAAIHPLDVVARSGYLAPMVPAGPTYVLGVDAAGIVDTVGPGVSDFEIGQPVLAMSNWPETKIGTQAEFVVLPAAFLAPARQASRSTRRRRCRSMATPPRRRYGSSGRPPVTGSPSPGDDLHDIELEGLLD